MMKRHRQPLEAQAAINVTTLLDTAFILLVTFMLVTPQLTHSLPVKLPEVTSAPTSNIPPNEQPIVITIQKKQENEAEEHVYVKTGGSGKTTQVSLEQLRDNLVRAKDNNPKIKVVLEADRDVPTGITFRVVAVLVEAKIENLGLSTEIEKAKDKTPPRNR